MKRIYILALIALVVCGASFALETVPAAIESTETTAPTVELLSDSEYRDLLSAEKRHNELARSNHADYVDNLGRVDKALEAGYTTQEKADSAKVSARLMYAGARAAIAESRPTPQSVRANEIERIEAANAEEIEAALVKEAEEIEAALVEEAGTP